VSKPTWKFFVVTFLTLSILGSSPVLFANSDAITGDPQRDVEIVIETNKRPWWIGDLLTVISILAGVGLIVFQLNKQHQNDIKSQKENSRDQLRLEVYEEFSKHLSEANSKTSNAGMYAFNLFSRKKLQGQALLKII
jgi:hypothetical protein